MTTTGECPLCGPDEECPGQHCLIELADVLASIDKLRAGLLDRFGPFGPASPSVSTTKTFDPMLESTPDGQEHGDASPDAVPKDGGEHHHCQPKGLPDQQEPGDGALENSQPLHASGRADVRRSSEACTCGSGAHPRRCALHPDAYDAHVLDLNRDSFLDDLLEEIGGGNPGNVGQFCIDNEDRIQDLLPENRVRRSGHPQADVDTGRILGALCCAATLQPGERMIADGLPEHAATDALRKLLARIAELEGRCAVESAPIEKTVKDTGRPSYWRGFRDGCRIGAEREAKAMQAVGVRRSDYPQTDEVDVEGVVDSKGVQFIGKAKRQSDGTWRCLANVGGAMCIVEVTVAPRTETATTTNAKERGTR